MDGLDLTVAGPMMFHPQSHLYLLSQCVHRPEPAPAGIGPGLPEARLARFAVSDTYRSNNLQDARDEASVVPSLTSDRAD